MKTVIAEEIATTSMVLDQHDGTRLQLRVVIGRPYIVDAREARCPVKIDGLDPQYADICGADTMQALCLAIGLIRRRLLQELERGGRLESVDGGETFDEASIAALFGVSASESAG